MLSHDQILVAKLLLWMAGVASVVFGAFFWLMEHPPADPNFGLWQKAKAARDLELSKEVKGDPAIEDRMRPIVHAFNDRFPDNVIVWGQYIQGGLGYGVFLTDGRRKTLVQLLSTIAVDGKPFLNDVTKLTPDERKVFYVSAFTAVDKALADPLPNALPAHA